MIGKWCQVCPTCRRKRRVEDKNVEKREGVFMSKIFEALQKAEQKNHDYNPEQVVEDPGADWDLSQDLVTLFRPGSVAAEQFRFLRTKVIRPIQGEMPRTLLITSPLQGEGKTFTACNLAVALAQGLDEFVLLVDTDLRNPQVNRIFGLDRQEKGLSTYLLNKEPLSALLRKTDIHKLTVLPAGQETEKPAEIISSKRMKSFIAEVRDRYPDRLVVFDSPPVQLAPETLVIANEVDGVFLVLRKGITPRDAAKSTLEYLKKDNFKGVIFNGYARESKYYRRYRSQGYKYNYGYGYQAKGANA